MKREELNKKDKKKLSYKYIILLIGITIVTLLMVFGVSSFVGNIVDKNNSLKHNDSIIDKIKDKINDIIGGKKDNDDDNNDDEKDDDGKDDKENPVNIIFSYYEKKNSGNGIKLVNQFPTSDEIGKAFVGDNYVFEFRLYFNKDAKGVIYNIIAEQLPGSDLEQKYVKVYLESEGEHLSGILRKSGRVKTYNEFAKYDKDDKQRILYKGTINDVDVSRGYKDFVFKMWVSEDLMYSEEYNNKTFASRINVYARSAF